VYGIVMTIDDVVSRDETARSLRDKLTAAKLHDLLLNSRRIYLVSLNAARPCLRINSL
jgi:hypothetical protein